MEISSAEASPTEALPAETSQADSSSQTSRCVSTVVKVMKEQQIGSVLKQFHLLFHHRKEWRSSPITFKQTAFSLHHHLTAGGGNQKRFRITQNFLVPLC